MHDLRFSMSEWHSGHVIDLLLRRKGATAQARVGSGLADSVEHLWSIDVDPVGPN
jgi:hypothetical protein